MKDIYFKIFKRGMCGIVGGVLGWPTLDHPVAPRGEGLGWVNRVDGVEYTSLGATIPSLDDQRKTNYNASVSRYSASTGQLMAVDDVTGDTVRLVDAEGARQLRAAAMMVDDVPFAQMEPVGVEFVVLNPGERAVVPVQWNRKGVQALSEICIRPEAPPGLAVLPGYCNSEEHMSIVMEKRVSAANHYHGKRHDSSRRKRGHFGFTQCLRGNTSNTRKIQPKPRLGRSRRRHGENCHQPPRGQGDRSRHP